MYATTLKCEKILCCGYVMDMRRFGGSGQRADFGSNEDAYVFNALNNALYIRFMPQKVHIRALLLLGYLQPLQTFSDVTQNWNMNAQKNLLIANLQSSFSHDDTMWWAGSIHQYAHPVANTQYYESSNTSYWSPLHALSVCYVYSDKTNIFEKSVFC